MVVWRHPSVPVAASIAAMGAAMVSLIDRAHDSQTPAPTAWMLCAGTAAVLATTMILAACLRAWDEDRRLYRPLAWVCAVVAVACLALGAARPAPALLGITLVLLRGIPPSA